MTQTIVVHSGIGFGAVLAIVLSWHRNKSILLAIIWQGAENRLRG